MAIYFNNIQGDVASIFLSYFQRAPEFEAMQHYVGVLQALQANPETAGNAFNLLAAHIYADGVASQEVPAGPTVTDSWYVSYLYSNVLGRAPDAEGLAYWVAELQAGNIARAELVGTFVAAALASEGRDAAYLNNRTEVAVEFAQWENSNPQVLPTLKYNAAEVLLGVNEDPATVAAAQSRLETTTGQVGETRNLTPTIDTIEGTTGNDTFNAVFSAGEGGASVATFTDFDSIDGDLGVDTFNIYVAPDNAANGTFPSNASVRNVEIVNIYNGAGTDGTLTTASNYEGVQQLWQIDSATGVSEVGAGTVVGFRNIQDFGSVVAAQGNVGALTVALDNVSHDLSDPDDNPFLWMLGDSLGTVNVGGALNAKSTPLNLIVSVGEGVRTLTVNTAVDSALWVLAGDDDDDQVVNHVDMSGSSGDILLALGEFSNGHLATRGLTATFGSGNDTIYFDADRTLALNDVIDGGEGDNVLAIEVAGRVQTQTYDAIARTANFDTVAFVHTGPAVVEVDVAQLAGFTTVALGGQMGDDEGDFLVSNLASDVVLAVVAEPDFDIGSPDVVTLKAAAADVTIALDGGANFRLSIDATNAASIGAKGGQLTLEGEGGVLFSNAGTGKFSTINASALEGLAVEVEEVREELNLGDRNIGASGGTVDVGLVLVDMEDPEAVFPSGSGLSGAVAETVVLNAETLDAIGLNIALRDDEVSTFAWDTSNSSTLGRMDVLEGFNSDADNGPLDFLVTLNATLGEFGLSAGATSLQLAFAEAAAAYGSGSLIGYDVLYFEFDGATYLFADTVGGVAGQYDNGDFALKIMGSHDLTDSWLNLAVG